MAETITISVDDSKFAYLLAVWMSKTGKTIDDALLTGARSLCRAFMQYTLPRDNPRPSRLRVIGDVYKVYASQAQVYNDIWSAAGEGTAKAFWSLTHSRYAPKAANAMVDKYAPQYRGLTLQEWDGGTAHMAARTGPRRSVPKTHKPVAIITQRGKKSKLEAYADAQANSVGLAKAGWVAAWRDLGNVSGVPEWIRRNSRRKELGSATRNLGGDTPSVVVHNKVRYALPALDEIYKEQIKDEAKARLMKYFRTQIGLK